MDLSPRDRLLTVLRGGAADMVPWTIYEWLLPDTPAGARMKTRGLTPIGCAGVCVESCPAIEVESREIQDADGVKTLRRIRTPVGELTEISRIDPTYGSRWISEHLIKSPADYRVMQFVYEHTTYEPEYASFAEADKKMGREGIVIGNVMPIPVQELLVSVMGPETWSEAVMLHADEFEELLGALTGNYHRQVDLAAASPAEVIWLPDNVTGVMMSPTLFNRYCKPAYDRACGVLKQAGKLTFAHYDGDNRPLVDCIASVDIRIIEAFTPPPMGEMTIAEAMRAWPDKVVSVNFPGSLFLQDAATIERHARVYMEEGGREGRFIMGCTEEYPVEQWEKTFAAIADAMGV